MWRASAHSSHVFPRACRALPSIAVDGTVTASNSSSLNDGASAVLLGAAGALDAEPLARRGGVAGNDPELSGWHPSTRAGRRWSDVDLVELNEAFAAQSLGCLRLWPHLDPRSVRSRPRARALTGISAR